MLIKERESAYAWAFGDAAAGLVVEEEQEEVALETFSYRRQSSTGKIIITDLVEFHSE